MPAVTLERDTPGPGFFGKLPDRGDFIARWLPRRFIDAWDAWLQGCIAISQSQMGSAWEDSYMTSPIWRFALPARLVTGAEDGFGAVGGVLMPSVDRVGRCYPLTLAAMTTGGCVAALPPLNDWYDRMERAALSALDDGTTLERFERTVLEITMPPSDVLGSSAGPEVAGAYDGAGAVALRFGCSDGRPDYPGLLDHLLAERLGSYSLWWTAGSDRIEPTTLVFDGLPEAARFTELLAGPRQEPVAVYGAPAVSAPEIKDDIDDLLA